MVPYTALSQAVHGALDSIEPSWTLSQIVLSQAMLSQIVLSQAMLSQIALSQAMLSQIVLSQAMLSQIAWSWIGCKDGM